MTLEGDQLHKDYPLKLLAPRLPLTLTEMQQIRSNAYYLQELFGDNETVARASIRPHELTSNILVQNDSIKITYSESKDYPYKSVKIHQSRSNEYGILQHRLNLPFQNEFYILVVNT